LLLTTNEYYWFIRDTQQRHFISTLVFFNEITIVYGLLFKSVTNIQNGRQQINTIENVPKDTMNVDLDKYNMYTIEFKQHTGQLSHLRNFVYINGELIVKHGPYTTNFIVNFQNDSHGLVMKGSKLTCELVYNRKKEIEQWVEESDVPKKFKANWLKLCPLNYCLLFSKTEFIEQLNEDYKLFQKMSHRPTIHLINDLIGDVTVESTFRLIFVLLMGGDKSVARAEYVYKMIKDRRNGSHILGELIYNWLPVELKVKIKKINTIFREEMERLRKLRLDSETDYKKIILMSSMPDKIKVLALDKIEEMKNNNNEVHKQLLFVKTLIEYPWENTESIFEELNKDLTKAKTFIKTIEQTLNTYAYGHNEVKATLLRQISKWITNPKSSGTSVGLWGPPGVGKTLIASSIGKALGLPFIHINLGGQNDGELLHGHGYTYTNSQPGTIIRKLAEVGSQRCIIYFDELDKCSSKNGKTNEITSILIHLTDPNTNKTFQDRFFQGIDFPLDKVTFMFSYNDPHSIDSILRDRLIEIEVKPYSRRDKIEIVNKYMLKEIFENLGWNNQNIQLNNEMLLYIIDKYTAEAGVRDLKRHLEKICLQINYNRLLDDTTINNITDGLHTFDTISITFDMINTILGKPKRIKEMIQPKEIIGWVNGLYATDGGGGGILPIQITTSPKTTGDQSIIYTGTQGDDMRESIQCAFTFICHYWLSNTQNKLEFQQYLNTTQFHVHATGIGIKKDGCSAGIAFTLAFWSLFSSKPIPTIIASTGEIDIYGNITKIGGLHYKLFGALSAGVKTVFIPKENEEDWLMIKEKDTDMNVLTVNIVESFEDVLTIINMID
jgi:ATP-dependent Lon protease